MSAIMELNSETIECAFCQGYLECRHLELLEDDTFDLIRLVRDSSRNALFCIECIARMQNKLNRRQERLLQRQWYTVDSDTDTINEYALELPSSQESSSTETSQDSQDGPNGSASPESSTSNRESESPAPQKPIEIEWPLQN